MTRRNIDLDTELRHGFDAGNYANAYETQDYDTALARLSPNRSEAYIDAFTLGFFGSYALEEMGEHADIYIASYYGPFGRRCKEIGIALPDDLEPTDESVQDTLDECFIEHEDQ